jgi:hypothetical protein
MQFQQPSFRSLLPLLFDHPFPLWAYHIIPSLLPLRMPSYVRHHPFHIEANSPSFPDRTLPFPWYYCVLAAVVSCPGHGALFLDCYAVSWMHQNIWVWWLHFSQHYWPNGMIEIPIQRRSNSCTSLPVPTSNIYPSGSAWFACGVCLCSNY